MAKRYDVAIKVISQQGHCAAGLKEGDEWIISGSLTPTGICLSGFDAMFPKLMVLTFGSTFSWEDDPDIITSACPDAKNPLVFELKRLPKK